MLFGPLGQGAQFVAQIREQQRPKGGIAGNQLLHRGAGQLVHQHLLGRDKAAAGAARDQAAAIKAIVRAKGGLHLVTLHLRDVAFDDDEQVGGLGPHLQHHRLGLEVGNIDVAAHQRLLVGREAIKRRGRKIKGIGHSANDSTGPGLHHACKTGGPAAYRLATYPRRLASTARATREPLGRPRKSLMNWPASISLSKSMPVSMPMPCSMNTTSSFATFPVAPFAYGQPPKPETDD